MSTPRKERPLHWVGSAKRDLLDFPADAVDDFGYGLGVVQLGGQPPLAKPWKGEGPGVFELIEDYRGDTYRVVYTGGLRRRCMSCIASRRSRLPVSVAPRPTSI